MYGGYDGRPPPFRPPPVNLPPFPPNLGPGGGPSNFPPFPPPNGFARPPFPPNMPPPTMGMSPGNFNGTPSPLPIRPVQSPFTPGRPQHAGIGLPPLPQGLPAPPNRPSGSSMPGFVKEVKTTSVFVGSIAPGVDDVLLRELLNACGPLHELKRVSGASGKPQAFGFALFENPEVVMRCIRCLNGVELPDQTPEGRRDRKPAKALVVKVDDKTREFLDEFEATVGRTEDDENADAAARKLVAQIVARMIDPSAPTPEHRPRPSGGDGKSPIEVIVPAHLQDLREGDLPENQRVAVLDQIAVFRENAARKERQKKALEEEAELAKLSAPAYRKPPNPAEYGYGTRAFAQNDPPPHRQQQGFGQPHGNGLPGPGRNEQDPQGYSKPVGFVKAQTAEAKVESGRTDEEEEEIRRTRQARDKEAALRDRERKVEMRERSRIESLNREMGQRKAQTEAEERNHRVWSERLEQFDDDEMAEKGKEWFWADRNRWRNTRHQQRNREYQDDVRDRQAEQDELKELERESEEFLKNQMEELARLEEVQKERGLLTEDAAPIKLALASTSALEPKAAKAEPAAPKPRTAIAFDDGDDDDEMNGERKKQRHLVKLEYDGSDAGLTEAEKAAVRNAQLLEIRSQVPRDRKSIWTIRLDWRIINAESTKSKIVSFVNDKLREYLGELDQDLADFIMENLSAGSRPDDMVDGLEPVLAEESTPLVTQLWRLLAFETAAAAAGLPSGSMLV